MKKVILLAILLSTQIMFGQDLLTLKLQSGVYSLNPSATEKAFIPTSNEIINDHYYRVLQFHQIPTNSEIQKLKDQGINLISYLPENAYLASIEKAFVLTKQFQKLIYAVAPLNAEMKLAKNLTGLNIPEYAFEGEQVKIVALVYPELNETEISTERFCELYSMPMGTIEVQGGHSA